MTYIALILTIGFLLVVILLVLMILALRTLETAQLIVAEEVRSLRLKSRTRVAQASMANAPLSEEAELKKLGRSTRAKRIVVGGDEDSDLHASLSKQVGE